jgi:DNA-binding transcriptional MerR regulator
MRHGFQIGEVSRQAGLSVDTIRFYEKERLLREPVRSEGGFRLFGSADIDQLKFIRKAQEIGFSLLEIKELLILKDGNVEACSHVRELLERKLELMRRKIEQLLALESGLKRALRKCNRSLNRSGDSHEKGCPVLKEIARVNGGKRKYAH